MGRSLPDVALGVDRGEGHTAVGNVEVGLVFKVECAFCATGDCLREANDGVVVDHSAAGRRNREGRRSIQKKCGELHGEDLLTMSDIDKVIDGELRKRFIYLELRTDAYLSHHIAATLDCTVSTTSLAIRYELKCA
jgi:hypothetical protein